MQVSLGDPAAGVEPIDLPFPFAALPAGDSGSGRGGGGGRAGRRAVWVRGVGRAVGHGGRPAQGHRGAVEGHPPRGDGGVLHVEVGLARIRQELAPEKVTRGGHGGAEVQRALNVQHDVEKVLLGLPLLFGAGAVKGRVPRGAERIGGNSVQHLGRHQGRELRLVVHQQEQVGGGP